MTEKLDRQEELLDGPENDAVNGINDGPPAVVEDAVRDNENLSTARQKLESNETDPETAKKLINEKIAHKEKDLSPDENDKFVAAYLSLAKDPTVTLTRDEIVAYEEFMGNIVFDDAEYRAVQLLFHREKVKQLTGEIKSDEFYATLCNAFIDKKYASERNDEGFRDHMKTWLQGPGKATLQPKVIDYFVTGLENNDGGRREVGQLSTNQVAALFDSRYDNFPLLATPLGREKSVTTEELRFKQEHLVSESLGRFKERMGLSDEVWNVVSKEVQPFLEKNVGTLKDKEIRQKYGLLIKNDSYVSFGREMTDIGTEIVAAQNRAYILGLFENNIDNIELVRHIEVMLDNTPSHNSINTFAQALYEAGDKQTDLIGAVVKHITKKGTDKTYKFGKITLDDLASDGVFDNKPGALQVALESNETETYFDSLEVEAYLDALQNQGNVESIAITLPAAQADLASGLQWYAEGNSLDIKISVSPDATEVVVDAVEVHEVQQNVAFKLHNLEYNQIGDHEKIAALLQQHIGNILRDPDYTITGGTIEGSASHVRTTHEGRFIDATTNSALHAHLDNFVPPQNDPNNIDVTNNPTLAFDRAASFLDYLLSVEGKVPDGAKFGITTETNGPTNQQMDETFARGTKGFETQRAEAAKEYQFANLSLQLTKKVRTPTTKIFAPAERPLPGKLLTLTTVAKPDRTASSPKLPIKNPIPGLFDSVKGIFGKGKPNYSKCPRF